LRFVHVTHRTWPVFGGSEQYVLRIARYQVMAGHEAIIIATEADDLSALWSSRGKTLPVDLSDMYAGVRILRLPIRHFALGEVTFPLYRRLVWLLSRVSPKLAMHLGRFAPWLPELSNVLAAVEADVFFAWNLTLEGLTIAVEREARRRGTPWVAVPLLHLARPRFYTMSHQLALLRSASRVLTQTETEQAYLLERGMDRQRVSVVSPGVDPDAASRADGERFRRKYGIPAGPVVVTISNLSFEKGAFHLVQSMRQIWRERRPVALVLIGPAAPGIRRELAKLPGDMKAWCHLVGPVSEADKWDALAAADVMALPSKTESFGIVFLEAWLTGTPVIGARSGAVSEVVREGVDGLLVDFGNVRDLADAVRTLVNDPPLAGEFGARGRAKVLQVYTWDVQYTRLLEMLSPLGLPVHQTGMIPPKPEKRP
jgi:glycogen synthase